MGGRMAPRLQDWWFRFSLDHYYFIYIHTYGGRIKNDGINSTKFHLIPIALVSIDRVSMAKGKEATEIGSLLRFAKGENLLPLI